jgi:hypothetical protein
MHHCSTAEQRVQEVSQWLGNQPPHGLLSQLSPRHEVSCQTLSRWKEKGARALQAALQTRPAPPKQKRAVQEQVLTLLIEAHASYRTIQTCLLKMCGVKLSVGSIARIVQEVGQRTQQWLSQQQAGTPVAWCWMNSRAVSEEKPIRELIDVYSGQVWATVPPVAVDGESWTLVWWYLGEKGVLCERSESDGGRAIQDALARLQRLDQHHRDVWHVLHVPTRCATRWGEATKQPSESA